MQCTGCQNFQVKDYTVCLSQGLVKDQVIALLPVSRQEMAIIEIRGARSKQKPNSVVDRERRRVLPIRKGPPKALNAK